jgi:peptide/nickel transport system ATP-binding protein
MSSLLRVDGLHVGYPVLGSTISGLLSFRQRWIDVLINVSISLDRGETLALVGESGAGKTTLGRTLVGLSAPSAGRMLLNGEDLSGTDSETLRRRRRICAMMFQDPIASLNPRQKVLSLVTEPFAIHGTSPEGGTEAAGLRLLDLVGLPAYFAERYPHELSGGQARRIGIARALALQPDLLIADEPTAGLDVSIQGAALNLLTMVQRDRQIGLLLITHNLAVVRHIADRVAVMYMGRIVETGTTAQILDRPTHPYTQLLVAAQPLLRRAHRVPQSALTEVPSLLRRPMGCEFHQRCPQAMPVCSSAPPALIVTEDNRAVRCHLMEGGQAVRDKVAT